MVTRLEAEWLPKIIGWEDGIECVFYQEGTAQTFCQIWFSGTLSTERQQYIEAAIRHVLQWEGHDRNQESLVRHTAPD